MSHVYKPSVSADFGPNCYIREAENGPNYISYRDSVSAVSGPVCCTLEGAKRPNYEYLDGSVKSKGYSANCISYRGLAKSKGYSPKPIYYRDAVSPVCYLVGPRLLISRAPNSYCIEDLYESRAYSPSVYTVKGSVSAPKLSAVEGVRGTSISAQIGPNSLVPEAVGCLFEATGSYGNSEPISSTSQSLGQAAGTTKEDLNHVHII